MKRQLFSLVLLIGMFFSLSALAQAQDISASVTFSASGNTRTLIRLNDKKYDKAWSGGKSSGSLDISSDIPMYGLYIAWEESPRAFTIEDLNGNSHREIASYQSAEFIHQYYPMNG